MLWNFSFSLETIVQNLDPRSVSLIHKFLVSRVHSWNSIFVQSRKLQRWTSWNWRYKLRNNARTYWNLQKCWTGLNVSININKRINLQLRILSNWIPGELDSCFIILCLVKKGSKIFSGYISYKYFDHWIVNHASA